MRSNFKNPFTPCHSLAQTTQFIHTTTYLYHNPDILFLLTLHLHHASEQLIHSMSDVPICSLVWLCGALHPKVRTPLKLELSIPPTTRHPVNKQQQQLCQVSHCLHSRCMIVIVIEIVIVNVIVTQQVHDCDCDFDVLRFVRVCHQCMQAALSFLRSKTSYV